MKTQHLASVVARCMAVLLACGASTSALGGDAWLIANKSAVPEGDPLWLSFVVGDAFPLGVQAATPGEIAVFSDSYGGETRGLEGLARQDRGLSLRRPITGRGLHVFGCAMRPGVVESGGASFGVDASSDRLGADDGDAASLVFERRWVYAKTMVEVLPWYAEDRSFETPVGHQLEIIPMSNPCQWRIDETVRVRVLLDGYPWGNVAVVTGHEDVSTMGCVKETRTDADGVAAITLTRSGHWFVAASLTRPSSDMGRARQERLCASLSFRVIGHTSANSGLQAVRMACGRLEPMAMVGHAMGMRAMEELGIELDHPSLAVVQQTPLLPAYRSISEGIVAACTTNGVMRLRGEEAPAGELLVVFSDRLSGRQVVFQLLPGVAGLLESVEMSPDRREEMTLRVAAMSGDALFVASVFEPDEDPAGLESDDFRGGVLCAATEHKVPQATEVP